MQLPSLVVDRHDGYVEVRMLPRRETLSNPEAEIHWELGELFSTLRGDNSVRVIVLTGDADDEFYAPAPKEAWQGKALHDDPRRTWQVFTGIIRCFENMVAIEKPIVARVNGPAVGLGGSLMFASDIIVARQDARIGDMHMAMGDMEPYGPTYGLVPGDGGAAFVPMHMAPAMAKEYLMLGRELTALQLAEWGIINYAVAPEDLDEVTADLVRRLLGRSAYALAWTKRVANRDMAATLNAALDAAAGYEMVNLLQIQNSGFKDFTSLE